MPRRLRMNVPAFNNALAIPHEVPLAPPPALLVRFLRSDPHRSPLLTPPTREDADGCGEMAVPVGLRRSESEDGSLEPLNVMPAPLVPASVEVTAFPSLCGALVSAVASCCCCEPLPSGGSSALSLAPRDCKHVRPEFDEARISSAATADGKYVEAEARTSSMWIDASCSRAASHPFVCLNKERIDCTPSSVNAGLSNCSIAKITNERASDASRT
mmetsp:Transcript_500/g.1647  ORF Transcript_500/g.1647 Transcript_500/m.1647 type:complete len:215 (+) Transcript_500:2470-3114(+)|eukprot:scaffold50099_cov32-Tisochrysis_lutea.AAC.3